MSESLYTVKCTVNPMFIGDTSELEEYEAKQLDAFLEREGFDLQYGHFHLGAASESSYSGHCSVTGVRGDVIDILWVQMLAAPE